MPQCTRSWISLLASYGEVSDKPVILTGQISAERALHSVGLSLLDRTESPPDKQKCSALFDSPRLFCVSWPWGGPPAGLITQWCSFWQYFILKWLGWRAPCYWCRRSVCGTFTLLMSVIHIKMKHLCHNKTTPLSAWEREGDCTIFSVAIWFKWHIFCVAKNTLFNANMLLLLSSPPRLCLLTWKGKC